MPGRSVFSDTTVANTVVSPYCASTVASAWRATLPVSSTSLRPAHSISTRCVSNISYLVSHCAKAPSAGTCHGSRPVHSCACAPREPPACLITGPLAADAQTLDDLLITPLVARLDVVEKPAAQTHHFEQTAPRMIVVLVQLEVLGKPVNALGKQRDLDLGRTGVIFLGGVILNELQLAL